jgi:thymidylate synthase
VIDLLRDRPTTRQAFIPIWFPEDTGAHHGERVPCTLGYHLMARDGRLKIVYYMRSCDFLRHFRDDVYMAGRLCQWVCERRATWR